MADILVVDDDELMIELISDLLIDEGHDVRSAMDGHSGLEAIAKVVPDLLILDMSMPGMDGYKVAQILRGGPRTAALPIIAFTGLDTSDDYDAAYKAGCSAFIAKPLQPAQLIEVVARLAPKAG
jgi:two-component system cell cycle response regulator DivK